MTYHLFVFGSEWPDGSFVYGTELVRDGGRNLQRLIADYPNHIYFVARHEDMPDARTDPTRGSVGPVCSTSLTSLVAVTRSTTQEGSTMSDTLSPEGLELVEENNDYNTYVGPDGDEVHISNDGEDRVLLEFGDLNLADEQFDHTRSVGQIDRSGFLDHLRARVTDPEEVDEVVFCDDCNVAIHVHEADSIDGSVICEECAYNYSTCEDCGDRIHGDDAMYVEGGDRTVCSSCYENNYSYCDYCDAVYADDYSDEHHHDDSCEIDCESPAMTFRVRNDGHDPLENDTRATMSLPAGVITAEGLQAITNLLCKQGHDLPLPPWSPVPTPETTAAYELRRKWIDLGYTIENIGPNWQGKDGNYTKRLSRYAYKTYGLRVPPEVISEVGNIARQHSEGSEVEVEVTRNLNLSAEDFGHEESCWWQSYYHGRCALKTNGGFGLRSFGEFTDYWGNTNSDTVTGRAWVMPVKHDGDRWLPTFETESPDGFIVFNGYGELSGYTPARIIGHMAGMTYRKITFYADPMYVNGESGYLVTNEELATEFDDGGTISLPTEQHSDLHRREQATRMVNGSIVAA